MSIPLVCLLAWGFSGGAFAAEFTAPDLPGLVADVAEQWDGSQAYVRAVRGGPDRPKRSGKFRWQVRDQRFDGSTALPLDDVNAAVRQSLERALEAARVALAATPDVADRVVEARVMSLVLETDDAGDTRSCSVRLRLRVAQGGATAVERIVDGAAVLPGTNTSLYSVDTPQMVFHPDEPSIFDLAVASALSTFARQESGGP